MEKIITMLESEDKEMVEMGVFYLLQEPLRPAEVNLYLQTYINNSFTYTWRDEVKEGESLIKINDRGGYNWDNSTTSIRIIDHDTKNI